MSTREILKQNAPLFMDIFRNSRQRKEEISKIQHSLFTRAKIVHPIFTTMQVVLTALGRNHWQIAYEDREKFEQLNHDLVDKTEGILTTALFIMIVLGVLLDICAWKNCKYARYIIYYELVNCLLLGFTPINVYSETRVFWTVTVMLISLIFTCDVRANIISCTVVEAILLLFITPWV